MTSSQARLPSWPRCGLLTAMLQTNCNACSAGNAFFLPLHGPDSDLWPRITAHVPINHVEQVGQDEIVMYLGKEMLASGELDEYLVLKQDVLLSMALAKVNMARDVFEAGNQVRVNAVDAVRIQP